MGLGPCVRRAGVVLLLVAPALACGLTVQASSEDEGNAPDASVPKVPSGSPPDENGGVGEAPGDGGRNDAGADASEEGGAPCEEDTVRWCVPVDAECGSGMQTCVDGVFGACIPQGPAPETCNGIDDDCNGAVDEPCPTGVTLGPPTTKSPTRGGNGGDDKYDDTCPADEALIGLTARVESFLRTIRAHCGKIAIREDRSTIPYRYTVEVTPGTTFPMRGKNTAGTEVTNMCPPNTVATGFSGREGALVDKIVLYCSPLSVTTGATTDAGATFALSVGTSSPLPGVGGNGGGDFPRWDCPGGGIINRIDGKTGSALDSITFHCATPSIATRQSP